MTMTDRERDERIWEKSKQIAVLQQDLASLIGGCNSYFSPDGSSSVKCNYKHRCPSCEANPPPALVEDSEPTPTPDGG